MPVRVKAFLVHLVASAAVILSLIAYVRWVWYPDALFWVEGVTDPLSVLFGVDVVLGPLLTLLLFVPGKKGLKFDMGMIIVLQVAALTYGAHVLWSARPVAVAFSGSAFQVARAYEMPNVALPDWAERIHPLGGPVLVFADLSDDPNFALKVLMEGQPDIHLLTEQYRPVPARMEQLHEHAYRLEVLLGSKPFTTAWQDRLGELPAVDAPVLVLPLYGHVADGSVVLDAEDGSLRAFLNVDITGIRGAMPERKAESPAPAAEPAAPDGPATEEPARDDDAA